MEQGDDTRPDQIAFGIACILVSVLFMAFADAVVKLVSAELTLWQVFAARALMALPILVPLMLVRKAGFRPRTPRWTWLRSVLLVLTWIAFYSSLPELKLYHPISRIPVSMAALFTSVSIPTTVPWA